LYLYSNLGFESGFRAKTNFRPDPDPKTDPKQKYWIRNTAPKSAQTFSKEFYNNEFNEFNEFNLFSEFNELNEYE
jgi:hypothetical protein